MVYYNLGLIFMVLAIISIEYDNMVLIKIIAEIWEQCSFPTMKSGRKHECSDKPTFKPENLNQRFSS